MPNDWTPQPPYPFDQSGKIETTAGRTRRQLLKAAAGLIVGIAAGFAGWTWLSRPESSAAKSGSRKQASNTAPATKIPLGSAAHLAAAAGPTAVTISGQELFVEFDNGAPRVLSAVCPHQGCNVEWHAAASKFVCPCHDSEFARDGSLLQGPSKEPLARVPCEVVNGTLYA